METAVMKKSITFTLILFLALFMQAYFDSAHAVEQILAPKDDLGIVSLDGKRLFSIQASLGPVTAKDRASNVESVIKNARKDPDFVPGLMQAVDKKSHSEIICGDRKFMTITEGDANLAGATHQKLANTYAERLKEKLTIDIHTEHASESLSTSLIQTGIATGIFVVLLGTLLFVAGRIRRTIRAWRGKYIRAIRVQKVELLKEETIYALLMGIVKITRLILSVLLIFTFVVTVLAFFPQTEHLSYLLREQLWHTAMNVVGPALVGYLPNLCFLIIIIFFTRYVLKFIAFITKQLESGSLKLPGFEEEWVSPTSNIVRFLILVFATMLAFPYLPGSDSPAFQQVALFLGVLVSLGSTGAVAHLIAGVFLTYTGAFRLNDRVRIADTVGDVIHKSLLATKVKTVKQEIITVPNGLVLGSHIINYSLSGTDPGLILHTTITIGYDVHWRKVEDCLKKAALKTEHVLESPEPFVLQTGLNDFSVAYQLNAYTNEPGSMSQIYSDLHKHIQDIFQEAEIEILSPEYHAVRDGNALTIPKSE